MRIGELQIPKEELEKTPEILGHRLRGLGADIFLDKADQPEQVGRIGIGDDLLGDERIPLGVQSRKDDVQRGRSPEGLLVDLILIRFLQGTRLVPTFLLIFQDQLIGRQIEAPQNLVG